MDAVLEARGVTLAYGRRTVLAGVDLSIRPGEFWFFLGPNGAGKTTLVRAILGELAPRAGTLRLHPELARRERIGFVPQRCELNPALPTTVREFVLLGTVGAALPRREEEGRIAWALERSGLGGMARRSYWSLSGGQRQRALVARALVRRPSFLIVDEPTSGLDPAAQQALLALLAELRESEHFTIVFVTHDLALPARWGTHLALVYGGRVLSGPRAEILASGALANVFDLPLEVDERGAVVVRGAAGGRAP